MSYKLGRKVKCVEEIELGGLYFFGGTLYVYAGRSLQFGNAYTFMCDLGTLYMVEYGVQRTIERGEMYNAKITKKDAKK